MTPIRGPTAVCIFVLLGWLCLQVSGYFIVTEPSQNTAWSVGATNAITWKKGLLDGIDSFDIEMTRLGHDGLTFIAKNVPAKTSSLNIYLDNIPPGDDYFLLFVNSTHGIMYTTSPKFTILPSSTSPPSGVGLSSPKAGAPTVTLNSTPNPTQAFATIFPVLTNHAITRWTLGYGPYASMIGILALSCTLGATLIWV